MKKHDFKAKDGIQLLLKKYRDSFRIPENVDYYSKSDYRIAEKKFIKYVLMGREAFAREGA
jgi:hypothetical protein